MSPRQYIPVAITFALAFLAVMILPASEAASQIITLGTIAISSIFVIRLWANEGPQGARVFGCKFSRRKVGRSVLKAGRSVLKAGRSVLISLLCVARSAENWVHPYWPIVATFGIGIAFVGQVRPTETLAVIGLTVGTATISSLLMVRHWVNEQRRHGARIFGPKPSRGRAGGSVVKFLKCVRWLLGKENRAIIQLTIDDLKRDRKEMAEEGWPAWWIRVCISWGAARSTFPIIWQCVVTILKRIAGVAELFRKIIGKK